jgi:hypothetical protein
MREVLEMVGWYAGLFSLSLAVSWSLHSFLSRRKSRVALDENAPLRILANGEVFRTRLISSAGNRWQFRAPMQDDAFVPIRVGESLTIEAPTERGLLRFRSVVTDRDATSHTLQILPPSVFYLVERRGAIRLEPQQDVPAYVDNLAGFLMDLGEHGARVRLNGFLARGERVRLVVPRAEIDVSGWVLETGSALVGPGLGSWARLRFEEPMELSAKKKKTLA